MDRAYSDSIFWVETEKIKPNPYQPRREFDERALMDLADSIRQYGVLQPLVVTRREIDHDDGGLSVEYELIAGERRLRASRLASLPQVPVIIRSGADDTKMKLELAIIENLQREDLNPIDRAQAFQKLHTEFGFSHAEIGKKMGKSREYVSNTLRLLTLPEEIRIALAEKRLSEGHTRPLMMLTDRPEEQSTLFKEVLIKKLSVREAERIARGIAKERARKIDDRDPQIIDYQEQLSESLGTRVHIEKRDVGGKIVIDFFSPSDLETILELLRSKDVPKTSSMLEKYLNESVLAQAPIPITAPESHTGENVSLEEQQGIIVPAPELLPEAEPEMNIPMDDRSEEDRMRDENRSSDLDHSELFTV